MMALVDCATSLQGSARSDAESLTKVSILRPQLFSPGLTEFLVFFLKLQKVSHLFLAVIGGLKTGVALAILALVERLAAISLAKLVLFFLRSLVLRRLISSDVLYGTSRPRPPQFPP